MFRRLRMPGSLPANRRVDGMRGSCPRPERQLAAALRRGWAAVETYSPTPKSGFSLS